MARSTNSFTLSFGLVSIPVKQYVSRSDENLSFNMLHNTCGNRIGQDLKCKTCDRTVTRADIVKGYAVAKDQYVQFTEEELKALEAEANKAIAIEEFVEVSQIDPMYFGDAHILGPDKGGELPFRLLVTSLVDASAVAIAQMTRGGKEHLVCIRPYVLPGKKKQTALALHDLFYANELRDLDDVDFGGDHEPTPKQQKLARQLVAADMSSKFQPEKYHDHYVERVKEAIAAKAEGKVITVTPQPPQAKVTDLLDALEASVKAAKPRKRA